MRDQAVRVELGIPLAKAAKLAGVSHITLRLYEADPEAVKSRDKRVACKALYGRLRTLLANSEAA